MRGSSPRMTRPPPSSFRRKPESSLRPPKLDPDFRRGDEGEDARIKSAHDASAFIVIPAKAGIQLAAS